MANINIYYYQGNKAIDTQQESTNQQVETNRIHSDIYPRRWPREMQQIWRLRKEENCNNETRLAIRYFVFHFHGLRLYYAASYYRSRGRRLS